MIRWLRHFAWSCLSLSSVKWGSMITLQYQPDHRLLSIPPSMMIGIKDFRNKDLFVTNTYLCLLMTRSHLFRLRFNWLRSVWQDQEESQSGDGSGLWRSHWDSSCFHFVTFIHLFWKIWTSVSGNGNDNLPVSFYMLRDIITYFKLFNWRQKEQIKLTYADLLHIKWDFLENKGLLLMSC